MVADHAIAGAGAPPAPAPSVGLPTFQAGAMLELLARQLSRGRRLAFRVLVGADVAGAIAVLANRLEALEGNLVAEGERRAALELALEAVDSRVAEWEHDAPAREAA